MQDPSGNIPIGTLSPDGRQRWDGQQWVEVGTWNLPPASPPPAPQTAAPPAEPQPAPAPAGAAVGTAAPPAGVAGGASGAVAAGPPAVGTLSQDGAFRWTGERWEPVRKGRTPTVWTRRLQLALAAYCVLAAIVDFVVTPVFGHDQARAEQVYAHTNVPSGMSAHDAAAAAMSGTLVLAIVFGVVYLLLGLASLRGWTWVWWVDGLALVVGLISLFTGIGSLADPSKSIVTLPGLVINELVSVAAGVLLVGFVLATIKYGPWARVKPGRSRA